MKIAFTSCMSTDSFPKTQAVWSQIAALRPDALVLLGDSVYIDVPHHPDHAGVTSPMSEGYSDHDFAMHLHALYQRQLAIPEFAALIAQTDTYAIWDDHDFLWDNAGQAQADGRMQSELMAIYSSNLFACWRNALRFAKEPKAGAAFPRDVTHAQVQLNVAAYRNHDPSLPAYSQRMPGYSKVGLFAGSPHLPKVVLHLTDGRSWRRGKTMLGAGQRKLITLAVQSDPTAVHLIASGSTFGASKSAGEKWSNYENDANWLIDLAGRYRVVMLSGDIHQNRLPEPLPTATDQKLYEITSSGAAVDFLARHQDAGATGPFNFSQNFGSLELTNTGIEVSLYHQGRMELGVTRLIPYSFNAARI